MSECSRFNYGEIVTICMWSDAVRGYSIGKKYIFTKHPVGKVENIIPSTECGRRVYQYRIIISNGRPIYVSQRDVFKVVSEYRNRKDMFDKFIQQYPSEPYFGFDDFKKYVDQEDQKKGKELLRLSKQCIKYDRERQEFLPEYKNIPVELEQSLNKVHDDMVNSLLYSVPTFYMKKEGMNTMFGVLKFEYKKIIFSGPCTIILWKDGTKTIAKTSDGEMFDPEKGVAICFMKRALGETDGKKVLRKANKDFYDEVTKRAEKDLKEGLTPMDEYLGGKVIFDDMSAFLKNSMLTNTVVNIDQSTIDEVKKVEEEQDD